MADGLASALPLIMLLLVYSRPSVAQQSVVIKHRLSFSSNTSPDNIAAGPDGALWVVNQNSTIARIETTGVITDFSVPGRLDPFGIAAGSD